jgi:hypothetical protein
VAGERQTHIIRLECLGCHEPILYSIQLPTAIICDHCGMISEARLSLHRSSRKSSQVASLKKKEIPDRISTKRDISKKKIGNKREE